MMIALQKERTRLRLVTVQRPTGRAGDLDIVMVDLAVAQHRHTATDERNVESGPLSKPQF